MPLAASTYVGIYIQMAMTVMSISYACVRPNAFRAPTDIVTPVMQMQGLPTIESIFRRLKLSTLFLYVDRADVSCTK